MWSRVFVVSVLALGVGCLAMPDPPPGRIDAPKDGMGSGSGFDAPNPFACIGNSPPLTAPPTIMLAGAATTLQGSTLGPASGVTVDLWRFAAGSYMLVDTSNPTPSTGGWTVGPVNTSGPLDAYLIAHLPTPPDRPTTFYPAYRPDNDVTGISLFAVSTANLDNALNAAGMPQDPAKGLLDLLITDCNGAPLSGATITVANVLNNVVHGDSFPVETLLGAGRVLWLNVIPGPTRIDVVYDGLSFRRQVVQVNAAANTATVIRPGY